MAVNRVQLILVVVAELLALFAVCLACAALFSTFWQVACVPEIGQTYTKGLFQICVYGAGYGGQSGLSSGQAVQSGGGGFGSCGGGTSMMSSGSYGSHMCTFGTTGGAGMLGGGGMGYGGGGMGYGGGGGMAYASDNYRQGTLALICLALIIGMVGAGLILGSMKTLRLAIFAAVCMGVAAFFSLVGICVFYVNAMQPDNMVMNILARPVQQEIGYSASIAIGSTAVFFLATLATVGLAFYVRSLSRNPVGVETTASHYVDAPPNKRPLQYLWNPQPNKGPSQESRPMEYADTQPSKRPLQSEWTGEPEKQENRSYEYSMLGRCTPTGYRAQDYSDEERTPAPNYRPSYRPSRHFEEAV